MKKGHFRLFTSSISNLRGQLHSANNVETLFLVYTGQVLSFDFDTFY